MRRELFYAVKSRLEALYVCDGEVITVAACESVPANAERVFPTVDLYSEHNDLRQRDRQFMLPAVLVEFGSIAWDPLVRFVEYRGEARVNLHILANWHDYNTLAEQCSVFELPEIVHEALAGLKGDTFAAFDLAESITDSGDEGEIVDNVEAYSVIALKHCVRP